MHGIYELKEMLTKELEEYGSKGELTAGSLDIVDKLAHSIKNLNKVLDHEEDGGMSYARGRGSRAKRDDMGRYSSRMRYTYDDGYSRDDGKEDMIMQLEEMMGQAPTPQISQRIERLISDLKKS